MSSLVAELQEAAQDSNLSVTDLLRKAKIVAHKLERKDLLQWVQRELNGYTGAPDVPQYRKVSASLEAFDPRFGWKRVMFDDPRIHLESSEPKKLGFPIPQLEEVLRSSDGDLFVPAPEEFAAPIMRANGVTEVGITVSRTNIAGILAAVRDAILDWSLMLEKAGIRGEEMAFSKEEKKKAQSSGTTINIQSIENFAGNISGEISGKAFITTTQSTAPDINVSNVKTIVQQIKEHIERLPRDCAPPIKQELDLIDSELKNASPNQSVLRRALGSIGRVLEGASGDILALGIATAISRILH